MPSSRVLLTAVCLAAWTSCNTPGEGENGRPSDPSVAELSEICERLHDAGGELWGERMAPVVRAGAAAEAPLIRLIENRPSAAGAQASVATLGRIGGDAAVELCRRLVEERSPLAVEAALALGELPGEPLDAVLLACLQNGFTDATLRTAAACSLARHGELDYAPRWIAAVVRAGTPAGRIDERELGVPTKTRWARERYFIQRTLLALGHQDLMEQLDTDASWPTLERLAPKVEARLRAGTKQR